MYIISTDEYHSKSNHLEIALDASSPGSEERGPIDKHKELRSGAKRDGTEKRIEAQQLNGGTTSKIDSEGAPSQ
jgi:hypothetical protein